MRLAFLVTLLISNLYGCARIFSGPSDDSAPRYFHSPHEAVTIATELLRKENWKTLSRYYDLSGSNVDRADLESGRFFIRTDTTPAAGQGGFSRYNHPFPPGFKFDHMRPTDDPNVIAVVVSIEIDQGRGLKKRGLSEFKMRGSERGYQILPLAREK